MNRIVLLLTLGLAMVAQSCEKNNANNFPNVNVAEIVYLNNPSNFDLSAPGGWVYINGGYKGIIVYRRFLNGGQNDFGAYDRGCPEHFAQDCGTLEVSEDGVYAQCPCDGGRYVLFDGSPTGNAQFGLKEYRATFDGQQVFISSN